MLFVKRAFDTKRLPPTCRLAPAMTGVVPIPKTPEFVKKLAVFI